MRFHAAVRRAGGALSQVQGARPRGARLPDERLRQPGAGFQQGDLDLLRQRVRDRLPDVRKDRAQDEPAVRRPRARDRPGSALELPQVPGGPQGSARGELRYARRAERCQVRQCHRTSTGVEPMRRWIAAIARVFAANGAWAQDKKDAKKEPTAAQKKQQERMKDSNVKAGDKKGDERQKFMSACLKGGTNAPTAAQK